MVILVPVDAAQLDSLCQYFMGMTVWNRSVPLSTWISALILRNTSKYITAVSPLEGSVLTMTPFILTKINLSFADFNWLILKITFQLWCLVHFSLNVILKHSNFYMSLASSFYFSTKPNCSNRNACKIPASAFQRHVGTVVFLADMTTCPETRSWQWWKTVSQSSCTRQDSIHAELLLDRKQPLELTTTSLCAPLQGVSLLKDFASAEHKTAAAQVSLKNFPPFSSITAVSEALPDIKRLSWFCPKYVCASTSHSLHWEVASWRATPWAGSACQDHFSTLNSTNGAAFPAE